MAYQQRWGAAGKTWRAMIEAGKTPPRQYFQQPELPLHLLSTWEAFFELTTERQIGIVVGPIPASVIKRYGIDECELAGDDLDTFCHLIARMDVAYLSFKAPPAGKPGQSTARVDDPLAVKDLLLTLKARSQAEKRKPRKGRNADA